MTVDILTREGLVPATPEELPVLVEREDTLLWIDIDDAMLGHIDTVGRLLNFHPLAIEDTRNDYQRPKVEEYDEHLFIIVNSLMPNDKKRTIDIEEVDIFLGRNYIVTIHSKDLHCLRQARERLMRQGAFRHQSTEFGFYVIIDVIVDSYFPALEFLENEIEQLEDDIIKNPANNLLAHVLDLKRLVNEITRVTHYQENMFGVITRHQRDLFFNNDILTYYLRDVHDHLIKSHSIAMSHTDSLSTLVGLYMSSTSNRLNIVVNRLAVATIIIGVLTVIGGFYGMNFTHTWPPFEDPRSLPLVLGVMIASVVGLVIYFKRRRLL